MGKYPDAKVVLTVRDPEKWYTSVLNTIYTIRVPDSNDPVLKLADDLIWNGVFKGKFEDKEAAIKIFNEHIEQVKQHVPEDRLLVFSVKDGWEPLCKFLDVPIPETPFPRINDGKTTAKVSKMITEQMKAGGAKEFDLKEIEEELAKVQ